MYMPLMDAHVHAPDGCTCTRPSWMHMYTLTLTLTLILALALIPALILTLTDHPHPRCDSLRHLMRRARHVQVALRSQATRSAHNPRQPWAG